MNANTRAGASLLAFLLLASVAGAQEEPVEAGAAAPPPAAADAPAPRRFKLGGEVKTHFRSSSEESVVLGFPFPPSFIPPGQTQVFSRTVDAGKSFEFSAASLDAEGDLGGGVAVKASVHFSDLYNRNPTSSDDRLLVREAWIRIGDKYEVLQPMPGTSFYVLLGQAPRFSKQIIRRLESYGLWGTGVGRFENPQLQLGGSFGKNVYWRGSIGNGNPVFFRDVNALAGDNGTPERVPGSVRPIFQSGFPILYDAKAQDVSFTGKFEYGGGLGLRGGDASRGIDVLGWYFQREMQNEARLRGTFYGGDLDLLKGVAFPLPFSGNDKRELGVNLEASTGGLHVFAQYVDQEIAKLPRSGFEVEAAYLVSLNGLWAYKDAPVGNWIQAVVRYSQITNDFDAPFEYPGPSVDWDWKKYDFGLRFGLVRDVDLTVEYAYNDATGRDGAKFHPNELLATLRAGF
jgi:hypothetical protein